MKTRILSNTEMREFNANMAVSFDYNDVAAASTGVAVNGISVLAGTKVQVVGMVLNTAFDITGTGALAVTVGDGGSATALQASTVIAADGTEILWHVGGSAKVYLVDDTVDWFFTDATSMAYTSGKVTFYLNVANLNELPVPV